MTRSVHSARKELRALIAGALTKEAGLPDGTARRVVNRILRQSGRLAEIGAALKAAHEPTPRPVVVAAEPAVAAAEAFDPYALGAVVTLHRLGADGLMQRLSQISCTENLVSLARAQNLSVPGDWSTADELRAAIVAAAEQRLAERHAAATVR